MRDVFALKYIVCVCVCCVHCMYIVHCSWCAYSLFVPCFEHCLKSYDTNYLVLSVWMRRTTESKTRLSGLMLVSWSMRQEMKMRVKERKRWNELKTKRRNELINDWMMWLFKLYFPSFVCRMSVIESEQIDCIVLRIPFSFSFKALTIHRKQQQLASLAAHIISFHSSHSVVFSIGCDKRVAVLSFVCSTPTAFSEMSMLHFWGLHANILWYFIIFWRKL